MKNRYTYTYKTRIVKKYQIIEVCLDNETGDVSEVTYDEIDDKKKAESEVKHLKMKEDVRNQK